ncbi:MAG: glycosyltransferase [Proteobacteria bacterium]|nr:glycosyltransferase [Pseudomonadota bacterium]
MRILHLIHSEGVYGAERILLYLAREQQERGDSPVVGSMRDPGTPPTEFERRAQAYGVPVEPLRIVPRPSPSAVAALLGCARAHGADVIHSHGYKGNILLGALPRGRRGPMISTLHGWTGAPRFSALWVYERLDRLALRRMDAVVAVGPHMRELSSLRSLKPGHLRVIENGIPSLDRRLQDLRRLGAPPVPEALVGLASSRPTLVAIGRLSAEKGFGALIEAFAVARTECPGAAALVIVGDGPERPALQRLIEQLGLQSDVLLPGYVEGSDRLLENARGFVMSSITEGMPLVLLEALQWRVPILATAVGSIPEVLAGVPNGNLIPASSKPALVAGLQAMIMQTPPSNAGVAADPARYSSARMAREYATVYESIQ